MGFAPDGYYSFEALDGTFNGLVRITDDRFECVHEGAWIDRPTILRHFVNPDVGNPLEPIDEATARRLADRYGVTLESLSRKLPQQDPHDPDPTFASPKRPTVARRLARRTAEAPG